MKVLYILIFIALLFIFIYNGGENRKIKDPFMIRNIPKIIHHVAPVDRSKWKEDWQTSYDTWQANYPAPEYTHYLWNEYSINNIVETKYISLYPLFKEYKSDIQRGHIAKYIILYCYGGIFVDMGVSCESNKSDHIDLSKLTFQYNESGKNNFSTDVIASPPNHNFWKIVIFFANKTYIHVDNLDKSTGSELINMCYTAYSDKNKIAFFDFK